jgi:hypothetical protein
MLDTASDISLGNFSFLTKLRLAKKTTIVHGVGGKGVFKVEGDFSLDERRFLTLFAVPPSELPPGIVALIGNQHLIEMSVSLDYAQAHPGAPLQDSMAFGSRSLISETQTGLLSAPLGGSAGIPWPWVLRPVGLWGLRPRPSFSSPFRSPCRSSFGWSCNGLTQFPSLTLDLRSETGRWPRPKRAPQTGRFDTLLAHLVPTEPRVTPGLTPDRELALTRSYAPTAPVTGATTFAVLPSIGEPALAPPF